MHSGFLLACVLPVYVSTTPALPPDTRSLSPATVDIDNSTSETNIATPNPLLEHDVTCLTNRITPTLDPADCGFILNVKLLQLPKIFKPRMFRHSSYMTDAGEYARSRWQEGHCEVTVHGPRHGIRMLTIYDVAVTANNILIKCVTDVFAPKGGLSPIGDVIAGFHVILRGYDAEASISADNSSVARQPAVSVSRRGSISRHRSEEPAKSQAVDIRDPQMGVPRVANDPAVTSNFTIDIAPTARYPVNCFNPLIHYLQPAAATDCIYIINQIVLRLFDPTRQLLFGFTDADDINLSKPEYQKWQYGQCLISVRNRNVFQSDTFRLLDVAGTARRITMQCVVDTQEKIGGTAQIGTQGRGFYVYVGGLLASSPALSDAMPLRSPGGVESF
ncbi:hypothetical protein IMSHALPRED_009843 [Imshaugia aleurites]|uniref:Uncharacterized protein n=1 Tax=Imshaugia aleurites TaxID=172621 RepID=A0A8H3IV25_9LECA|nr:hypothetical protein IMSHALPRED_009843 [Imshaugia aleurites]